MKQVFFFLFKRKLKIIIQIIDRGLNEITWKSLNLSDYIEEAYGLINRDASLALEIVQRDVSIIRELAFNWSQLQGDIFDQYPQNLQLTFQQTLQKHQQISFIFK